MSDVNPKEQKTFDASGEYLFWYGCFLNQLPPVTDRENRLKFIKETKIPYGRTNPLHFANPQEVSDALEKGLIPTPSIYDILREGNTAHQIIDTWRSGGKSRLEKEADKTCDQRYGQGQWQAVAVEKDQPSFPDHPMQELFTFAVYYQNRL